MVAAISVVLLTLGFGYGGFLDFGSVDALAAGKKASAPTPLIGFVFSLNGSVLENAISYELKKDSAVELRVTLGLTNAPNAGSLLSAIGENPGAAVITLRDQNGDSVETQTLSGTVVKSVRYQSNHAGPGITQEVVFGLAGDLTITHP